MLLCMVHVVSWNWIRTTSCLWWPLEGLLWTDFILNEVDDVVQAPNKWRMVRSCNTLCRNSILWTCIIFEVAEKTVTCLAMSEHSLNNSCLLQINSEANKEDPCVTKIKDCVAKSRALLAATENVEEAAQQLLTVTGTDLTLAGQAYPPPGALRRAALSDFCTRILLRSSELA